MAPGRQSTSASLLLFVVLLVILSLLFHVTTVQRTLEKNRKHQGSSSVQQQRKFKSHPRQIFDSSSSSSSGDNDDNNNNEKGEGKVAVVLANSPAEKNHRTNNNYEDEDDEEKNFEDEFEEDDDADGLDSTTAVEEQEGEGGKSNNKKRKRRGTSEKNKHLLDSVISNNVAYSLATEWWETHSEDFHAELRKEAVDAFHSVSSSSHRNNNDDSYSLSKCSKTISKRLFYTHRKPRAKEVSNLEMAVQSKQEAFHFVEIGDPLHRVVNPQPVQLNSSFDFYKKRFGNWHVTFVPEPSDARSSPQRVPAEPAMSVSLFKHAVLSYGNVVSCSKGISFSAGGCLWEGPSSHVLASTRTSEVKNIIAVALCDGWCRGYYHFSHEHLPRLALVHDLLTHSPHAHLVLSHSPVGFAKQFYIDILKIPKERILVAGGGGTGFRAGVVALPTPMRCGNAFTSALVGLRKLVLSHLLVDHHPELHKKSMMQKDDDDHRRRLTILFAERSHLSRMPRNYETLKDFIKKRFGSVAVFEETQGKEHAREQVLRFYRADIVIGPHGANLANIMFMKPGSHVLEMASAKNGNLCYYSTAMRMNLTHHLVLHDKGKDSHYSLTREILEHHLEHAIKLLLPS